MNIKSFLIAAASTAGILTLSSPASAVIYNWQFTNEDGNFTTTDPANQDIVTGFVEFNDADVQPNATDVQAIDLQITSVTNLPNGSDPFFGDGGIELNQNLATSPLLQSNSFSFSSSETPISNFFLPISDNRTDRERFFLRSDRRSFVNNFSDRRGSDLLDDSDSSTLTFS